jgi:hypothetical protein
MRPCLGAENLQAGFNTGKAQPERGLQDSARLLRGAAQGEALRPLREPTAGRANVN